MICDVCKAETTIGKAFAAGAWWACNREHRAELMSRVPRVMSIGQFQNELEFVAEDGSAVLVTDTEATE